MLLLSHSSLKLLLLKSEVGRPLETSVCYFLFELILMKTNQRS